MSVKALDLMRGSVNHPADGTPVDGDGLDALWRQDEAFVGPVEPPMIKWVRMGSPPSAWQVAARARRAGPAGEQFEFDLVAA